MVQMDYNLLFRWFVGLAMDAPIRDVTVLTRNPREAAVRGRCRQGPVGHPQPDACAGASLERSFPGGRHVDRSVDPREELQAEG